MDFTTLCATSATDGSVASFTGSDRVSPGIAAILIDQAQSLIYRKLRHWSMLTEVDGVFTINQDYSPLPTDYLQAKSLYLTGTNYKKLTMKPLEEVKGSYSYDANGNRVVSQPSIYYYDQTNLRFDTVLDQAYPYMFVYYQQPAALSASNNTNFLTQRYQRLLWSAIMVSACEFLKEVGQGTFDRAYWLQQFEALILDAQMESEQSMRSVEAGMYLT